MDRPASDWPFRVYPCQRCQHVSANHTGYPVLGAELEHSAHCDLASSDETQIHGSFRVTTGVTALSGPVDLQSKRRSPSSALLLGCAAEEYNEVVGRFRSELIGGLCRRRQCDPNLRWDFRYVFSS